MTSSATPPTGQPVPSSPAPGLNDEPTTTVRIRPGREHWRIFENLCRDLGARGNVIPDAFLAAMAIEVGATFITTDAGFARFPGLRWRRPFDTNPGRH